MPARSADIKRQKEFPRGHVPKAKGARWRRHCWRVLNRAANEEVCQLRWAAAENRCPRETIGLAPLASALTSLLTKLHDYFSKWNQSGSQTREKVPLLFFTLGASCFGPGKTYDTLVIELFSQVSARMAVWRNAAIVQAFVQARPGPGITPRSSKLYSIRKQKAVK